MRQVLDFNRGWLDQGRTGMGYVRVRKPPCACAALCWTGDGRVRAIDPVPRATDGVHPAEGFQGNRIRATIPTYGMGAHSVFEKLPQRCPQESSSTATNIRLPFSRTRSS